MELLGKRIVLRKAKPTDLDAIYRNVYGDAQLLSTMFFPPCKSREEAAERLQRTIALQKERPLFFAALEENDEAIGLGGIMEESEGVFSEAGLAIGQRYQGNGYAAEMLKLLLELAFSQCGASQFVYYTMVGNEKSKRLALRFGFRYDSVREEVRSYDQQTFPIERYLLTKEEYFRFSGSY